MSTDAAVAPKAPSAHAGAAGAGGASLQLMYEPMGAATTGRGAVLTVLGPTLCASGRDS